MLFVFPAPAHAGLLFLIIIPLSPYLFNPIPFKIENLHSFSVSGQNNAEQMLK